MKIWYLKFPLTLYKESKAEIKEIAKKEGFIIISAVYGTNEVEVPKLTLVNEPIVLVEKVKKTRVKKIKDSE